MKTKTTKRFDAAVPKLYKAFHAGELNMCDPCACAVGNICNNNFAWIGSRNLFGKTPHIDHSRSAEALKVVYKTGYSVLEIIEIECLFMSGVSVMQYHKTGGVGYDENSKEDVFKGMCKVIEYLCELDNIPNVLDYTSLFEYDQDSKPKHELSLITV